MDDIKALDELINELRLSLQLDPNGEHVSGWQSSPSWSDTMLDSSTQYCYRVRTRDKSWNMNESEWSDTLCATTRLDR